MAARCGGRQHGGSNAGGKPQGKPPSVQPARNFKERRVTGEIGRIGLEASQMATLGPPQHRIHGGRYFRWSLLRILVRRFGAYCLGGKPHRKRSKTLQVSRRAILSIQGRPAILRVPILGQYRRIQRLSR
jgi:hypothetical protein